MRRKKINQWLKRQSLVLPEEKYQAIARFFKPIKDEQGQLIWGVVEEHNVNHYRRIKKLFLREGLKGVNYYFLARGFEIKINK